MTLARRLDPLVRITRRPRALAALVAASALVFGVAAVGHSAGVDARARAALNGEIERVAAAIERSTEHSRAAVTAQFDASVCVIEASERLAPVVEGAPRFTTASLDLASTAVQSATDAAAVPAYDPAPPPRPSADASVDDLDAALLALRSALDAADAELAVLASAARSAQQECTSARTAVSAVVAEVTRRTDEVIAAGPKAAATTSSELGLARDAVVAGDDGAIARWIAGVAAVEASHAAALLAEQQAEAAARQASQGGTGSTGSSSGGTGVSFDTTPAPGDSSGVPRPLTHEELCALVPNMTVIDLETGEPVPAC